MLVEKLHRAIPYDGTFGPYGDRKGYQGGSGDQKEPDK